MSVSGGIEGGNTLGGKGFFANQNFQSSGSRGITTSSNLVVGETVSGSLAEIRGWSTSLSTSKFRQLPIVWKFKFLKYLCMLASPFIPVRTKNKTLRWSRELMLLSSSIKPLD